MDSKSLQDLSFIKDLVVRVLIYKLCDSKKIFDHQFYKDHPLMNQSNTVDVFINILNSAISRLQEIFIKIKEMKE